MHSKHEHTVFIFDHLAISLGIAFQYHVLVFGVTSLHRIVFQKLLLSLTVCPLQPLEALCNHLVWLVCCDT